jgi:aspartate racemase
VSARRAPQTDRRRTVGVLGGMGPLATADFYAKLVRLTPARRDQDHLHVIIDSDPQIPDRTAAALGRGPDPTPTLVAAAQRLVRAGAELIAIPCNSAHAFLPDVRRAAGVPVLDIMEEVAAAAAGLRPSLRRVGLLATTATVRASLYHVALAARGISVLAPAPGGQKDVMRLIHAVKAGDLRPAIRTRARKAVSALVRRGAEAIVLGCTELPLVVDSAGIRVPLLDGTEILARAAVREARAGRRAGPSTRMALPAAGGSRGAVGEFRASFQRSHKARTATTGGSEPLSEPMRRN